MLLQTQSAAAMLPACDLITYTTRIVTSGDYIQLDLLGAPLLCDMQQPWQMLVSLVGGQGCGSQRSMVGQVSVPHSCESLHERINTWSITDYELFRHALRRAAPRCGTATCCSLYSFTAAPASSMESLQCCIRGWHWMTAVHALSSE
jgi:hypothetical protein